MTGAVVGVAGSGSLSIFGFVVALVSGIIFASGLEERVNDNPAAKLLKGGTVYTKSKELVSLARDCGYTLEPGRKEGTVVLKEGKIIAVIPNHKSLNKYTAKGIMKAYASGESSFRKK